MSEQDPLVLIGVLLVLPGLLLLPRRLQVKDGVLITRRPFLMTRRAVEVATISCPKMGRSSAVMATSLMLASLCRM